MRTKLLPLICCLVILSSKAMADEYTEFWSWFVDNQARYFEMDVENISQRNKLFAELSGHLISIDENLTFEFGKLPKGKMDFVISAGGIEATFPKVIKLVDKAPTIKNWKITAFRQPKDFDTTIEIAGAKVDPKETLVQLFRDGEKIGVVLYIPEFKETPHQLYEQLGFLLLDQTLGEYVVGTKVGFIEFKKKSNNIENAMQLSEMRRYFK
jgi:hypothetical protein